MTEITIANGRFRLDYKIAAGGYSRVYVGTDTTTNKEVAIKLENVHVYQPGMQTSLELERDIYHQLPRRTFPQLLWMGRARGDNYDALVTDLLGPSLRNLWVYCDKTFGQKTLYMVACQTLKRLRALHEKGLIHNDIKPSNFALGTGAQGNNIFLIDYGLATRFEDIRDDEHVRQEFRGTVCYGSLRAFRDRLTKSYRDDLESLALTLVQLAKGNLPWERARVRDEMLRQMEAPVDTLCGGLPEIAFMIEHARGLRFDEKPNYRKLCKMFEKASTSPGIQQNMIFDWVERRYMRIQQRIAENGEGNERGRRREREEDPDENAENVPPARRQRVR